MLFRKKVEELSDQLAAYKEREAPRFMPALASISIEGIEGEGQVGNISTSGCSMESVTYAAITPDQVYNVRIIPDGSDRADSFSLTLKLNWTKSSETLFQAGFSIESGQNSAQLRRYVDFLQSRGIKPDYGNMGLDSR